MTQFYTLNFSSLCRFRLFILSFLLFFLFFQTRVSAQFTITENFKNSSAGSNIILGGSPNTAKLTSGVEDPAGNGWLRLTNSATNQRGYAYVNSSFPSTLGVIIDFEYKTWRSTNDNTYQGADGIGVFLFDASVPFQLGGYGGSLGYSPNTASVPPVTTGLAGGYIGIGLDEYGNFSNPGEGKVGGPGLRPNSVALRGVTTNNPLTTNAYLTGVQLATSITANEIDYNTVTTTRPTDAQFYRRVQIEVVPSGANYVITVRWTKTVNGAFTNLISYTTTNPPPANLKLGFAGSSGGGFNFHEIRNLLITTPGGFRTDKSVDKTNALVGDQLTYTVNAYNFTTAPITGLKFADTLKTSTGALIAPADFTIQSVTFNNNGNTGNTAAGYVSGVAKTTGNVNPIATTLNMAASSKATFTVTGLINRVPPGQGTITNTVGIDPSATGIIDTDLTNNTFSVATNVLSPNVDFTLKKVVDNTCADPVNGNTYSILVLNSGANASVAGQTVTVTDVLPTGVTLFGTIANSIDAVGWTITNPSANTYRFTRTNSLASSFTYPPINIRVRPPATGLSWNNTATVAYTGTESNTTNNTSEVAVINSRPAAPTANGVTYCQGATAVPLTATGTNLKWYTVAVGGVPSNVAPTPLTTTAGTTIYYVSQSNGSCESALTPINVVVQASLANNIITSNQTICATLTPITLAGSTPTGGSGTYTYLWEQSINNGTTWTTALGTNNTINYSPAALSNTTLYRRIVTSGSCTVPNISNVITITVQAALANNTLDPPVNSAICVSGNPGVISGSLPTGGSGTYTYQWQSSLNNTAFTNIAGATAATFDPGVINVTTYYRRQVTSGACTTSLVSNVIKVTVNPALTAGTIGANQVFCANGTPATFTELTAATGGDLTYTYQWQVSTVSASAGFVDIPGASQVTYTPTQPITQTTYYKRVVNSGASGCGPQTSNVVTVTINPVIASNAITAPSIIAFCASGNATSIVGSTPIGGDATYAYSWQQSIDNGQNWTAISGATSKDFDPPAITTTTSYRRLVNSGNCSDISNAITITINNTPTVANAGLDQQNCNQALFTLAANTPISGTGVWTVVAGQATINNPTAPNSTVNVPAGQSATLAWTISNGVCTPSTDQVILTNYSAPSIANAGQNITQNNSGTFTMQAIAPSSGTGIWTVKAGSTATIAAPTNPNTTVTIAPNTSATLIWTVSNGNCTPSTAEVTITYTLGADINVVKSVLTPGPYTAGQIIVYRILVSNGGPSNASGLKISDIVPANIVATSINASGIGNASVTQNSSSGNNVDVTANINSGAGNEITIDVTGKINANFAGSLINTATVNSPNVPDPNGATSTVTIPVIRNPILNVIKEGPANAIAGDVIVYKITVSNTSTSDAINTVISDIIPSQITNPTWTVSSTGSATFAGTANGTGNVNISSNIPAGAGNTIVLTINGTISSAAIGSFNNTAVATPSEPGVNPVSSNTVTTNLSGQSGLVMLKNGPANAQAGNTITYTLKITNNGLSNALNAVITDIIPSEIKNASWSSSITGAATIISGATGTGNSINLRGNIPTGAAHAITVTITGTIDPSFNGTINNTATATPSEAGSSPSSSTVATSVARTPVISLVKTGPTTLTAGQSITYTIEASNTSIADARALVISDDVPIEISNVVWTASTAGNATIIGLGNGTGNNIQLSSNLPSGSANKILITVTGVVSASFNGSLINKATATPAESGTTPISSTTTTQVSRLPVLAIFKTGPNTIVAGQQINYTITVTNSGTSDALLANINDIVPTTIKDVSWTSTIDGAANISSGATGSGNTVNLTANIPSGAANKITITVRGTVDADFNGSIINTAKATPAETGANEVSATSTTNVNRTPEVSITKTSPAALVAGQLISYTITVNNFSNSNAKALSITDVVPATVAVSNWSAAVTGSAIINGAASGVGNNISLNADLPAGVSNAVVVTINGVIAPSFNGVLTNTATATPAEAGTIAKSATSTTNVSKTPVLTIQKSGPGNLSAGENIFYTLTIGNTSTANADNLTIKDLIPSSVNNISWSATVAGVAQIISGATGTGNDVEIKANIPAGSANVITVNISGTVNSSATGQIVNTATATPAETGTQPANSTLTTVLKATPSLSISKTGPSEIFAGQSVTYKIIATNNGPSDAINLSITDVVPVILTGVSWTANVQGAATISAGALGVGNNVLVRGNIIAGTGNQLIVTITGTVPASTGSTSFNNTATATPTEAGVSAINSNTITTVVKQQLSLSAVKAAPATASAGENIIYTLQIKNNGPSDALNLLISDQLPTGINNISWTATTTGSAILLAGASGTGSAVNIRGNLPAGASNGILVTITGKIDPNFSGTQLQNSFTVTPTEAGNSVVTSNVTTTQISKTADLQIQKTGPSTAVAGQPISYQITVNNAGPSNTNNVSIVDQVPAGITNVVWTAIAQNGATINGATSGVGNAVNVMAAIPAGAGTIVITVNGIIDAGLSVANVINTATATPEPGVTDPTPAANTVTTVINRIANLRIIKSGPADITAGEAIQYSLFITNDGPSTAPGVLINDVIPTSINNPTWTATVTGGASIVGSSSGTGNVNLTANIPTNGVINVVVNGLTNSGLVAGASISNTATVAFPPGSPVIDPDQSSNTSTITTKVNTDTDLRLSKSGPSTVNVGDRINYRIEVKNGGSSNITNAVITDNVPADVLVNSWTAIASNGATITGNTNGTSNVIFTNGDIPANSGASIVILVEGIVRTTAGATFTNTAEVTANEFKTSSVVTAVNQSTDIFIEKTGPQTAISGNAISYTIKVGNAGPREAIGLSITDNIPAAVKNINWTAIAFGDAGTSVVGTSSGNSANVQLNANITPGAANYILIKVDGIIDASTANGNLTNTALVTLPSGLTDFNLANNTSSVITAVTSTSGLSVLKMAPATSVSGAAITYTIRVANAGPSNAVQTSITDAVPANITNVSWSAVTNGNAVITEGVSGTGNNLLIKADIPAGTANEVQITVTGTIDPSFVGILTNRAIATPTEPGNPPVNSGDVITNVVNQSNLNIVKSGPTVVEAGRTIQYTVEVTNTGLSNAVNAVINDALPTGLTNINWSASAINGAQLKSANTGTSNPVTITADISSGTAKVIIQVTATIPSNTSLTSLTNTASVQPSEAGNPIVISNDITTAIVKNVNLSLTKSAPATLQAGQEITYTISLANNGPSAATGLNLVDMVPSSVNNVTWSSTVNGGAAITSGASGNGNNLSIVTDLPVNSTVLVTIKGIVDPSFAGTITNNTTATPLEAGNNPISAQAVTEVKRIANLTINKSGPAAAIAGQEINYQIIVANNGPSTAINAVITDAIAAELQAVSWTATAEGAATISAGASGIGNAVNITTTLPAGQANRVVINVFGKISATFAGTINNVAVVTPSGSDQPPVSTPVVETVVSQKPVINLSKTGPATAISGSQLTYVIEATNSGLSDATNLLIEDLVPAAITNINWTAVASGNSNVIGIAQGANNNINVRANIPAGAGHKIVITITGTVNSETLAGILQNQAKATPSEPGNPVVTSPIVETVISQRPVIEVRKTGPGSATAGGPINYVVEVSNSGLSNAKNLAITDIVSADISDVTWVATPSGMSSINGASSGSGNSILVNANIPTGNNKISIAITGIIKPAFAGKILNTATATPSEAGNTSVTSPTVETNVNRIPIIALTKTGAATGVAGDELTYVIEVANTGLSDALGFTVIDDVPVQLTNVSWIASTTGSGSIITGASGSGNNLRLTANLPAGAGNNKIIINVKGTINPAFAGRLLNSARVEDIGTNIPNVITPPVQTEVGAVPGITINKNGPATALAGSAITYVIKAGNTGLSNAKNLLINDQITSTISNVSWTAVASGAAVINSGASGSGNALILNADIPAGVDNVVTITVKGTIAASFNGNLVNNVTATPSENNVSPVNSSVTTVVNKTPTLAIVKNGPSIIAAGEPIAYTIRVSNSSTANADNSSIIDQVPVNISEVRWTAVAEGSATIVSGSTGNGNAVNVNANIPAGAANVILITVNGIVNSSAIVSLVNTAIVSPTEPGSATANSTVTTTLNNRPSVTLVKTGPSEIYAGEIVTYTLRAGNNGPSDAHNVNITDVVPAALTDVTWTASTIGNANILTGASGTGNNVALTGHILAGATNQIVITITGKMPASAAATNLSNTATATPSEPGNPAVPSNNITTNVTQKVTIRAIKSAPSSIVAGQNITYGLQIFNDGPSDAVNLAIADIVPAGINNVSWQTGAIGAASIVNGGTGTGNAVALRVNIPSGASNFINITITGTVDPAFVGTSLKNQFTVSPSEPGNPPVTSDEVTTMVSKVSDLQVLKTAPATLVSGSAITYTITASNSGPSTAIGTTITDVIPAGLSNINWTAIAQDGAVINGVANGTGNINLNASIPSGNAKVVITVNALVEAGYTGANIVNTVTATPSVGIIDPTPATSTVSTLITSVANVRITKSGPANIAAGELITYNLRIVNDGPSNAVGLLIKDALPSNLDPGATWTATVLNGATVSAAAGVGDIDIIGNIPTGDGEINIEIKGRARASNADGTIFINTASANFPPGSITVDPDLGSNVSSVITKINNDPVLKVSKSGPSIVDIGDPINYTIVIRNGGAGDIVGAQIEDPVPSDVIVSSWTVVASGGATVTGTTSGTGNNISTLANIPADADPNTAITLLVNGVVSKAAGVSFKNTVTVTANGVRESTVVTAVNQSTDIAIEKSGPQTISAGSAIAYTIKVKNNGPVDVVGLTINDNIPLDISNINWTAQAFGSATLTGPLSGNNNTLQTQANVPNGDANYVLITVNGIVKPSTSPGVMTNVANVVMPIGIADFNMVNNSSTVQTTVGTVSGLAISKIGPQNSISGSAINYLIKVINNGPSNAVQAVIKDAIPAGINNVSWIASATGTATIVTGNTGNGNSLAVIANIPAGLANEITISISGTIDAGFSGVLTNIANVTPSEAGGTTINSGTVTTNVINKSSIRLIKSGPSVSEAGKLINYSLELTNAGPGNAMNVDLTDVIAASLTNVNWTSVASNGAIIKAGALGSGNLVNLKVDLPAGNAKVVVNITALIPANTTVSIANTATATPTELGNPAVVSNPITTTIVNNPILSLVKTGPASARSGALITYSLLISNAGPSDAVGVKINDVVATELNGVTWTTVVNGGSTITAGANGTGNNVSLTANVPANGNIVVSITGTIAPSFVGSIVNRATLNPPDATKPAIVSEVTTTVSNLSNLIITKTGVGAAIAGQEMSYDIIVRNAGPSTAQNVLIADRLQDELSNVRWTAVASGAATISVGQSGTGNTLNVRGNIPSGAGDFITITIKGIIDPSFAGKLINVAIATPSEPGNQPVVTPPVETNVIRKPGINVVKSGPQTAKSGDLITYIVEVTNTGSSDAFSLNISDRVGIDISNVRWTTTVAGRANLISGGIGNGNTINVIGNLPAGDANKIIVTITGTISKTFTGRLINTARTLTTEGAVEGFSNTVETVVDVSDFIIPNIITPNGDGKNDTFKIKGIENYPGTEVIIFNRWGNEVFKGKDYKSDWDGSQLNEGTYYYLVMRRELLGTSTIFKGWLFIKR